MKKFMFILIAIIVIVLAIVLFKICTTTKYSSDDVKNLILKGAENMDKLLVNGSFERKWTDKTCKYYYKGNKMKILVLESSPKMNLSSAVINLDEKKLYLINDKKKYIVISEADSFSFFEEVQYNFARLIKDNNNPKHTRKYEYKYIKDEPLDGKDCIFVKEEIFILEDGNYISINEYEPEKKLRAFWIEKSTGFILGFAMIKPNQNTAAPETIMLRNISFGDVVDKDVDFDLPSDYTIIDNQQF